MKRGYDGICNFFLFPLIIISSSILGGRREGGICLGFFFFFPSFPFLGVGVVGVSGHFGNNEFTAAAGSPPPPPILHP